MSHTASSIKNSLSLPRVTRNENRIIIHRMDHPSCVSSFMRALQKGIKFGYNSFVLEWQGTVVYRCAPAAYAEAKMPSSQMRRKQTAFR